jgi:hypothetical protein
MRHLLPELANSGNRKAAKDRHKQHLQQVAARERADERAGNDVQQVGRDAFLSGT